MAKKDHGTHNEEQFDELPDVSYIKNEDVQHEHTDVPVGPVVKFLLALSFVAIVIHVGMYFFFEVLEDRVKREEPAPGPFAEERSNIPPEPRLHLMPGHEVHPLDEWKQMRATEEEALSSYGWVDAKAGVVRIPIEEGKRLVLQQGLPSRPTAAPQGQAGSPAQATPRSQEMEQEYPSDQSSGRMQQRRRQ